MNNCKIYVWKDQYMLRTNDNCHYKAENLRWQFSVYAKDYEYHLQITNTLEVLIKSDLYPFYPNIFCTLYRCNLTPDGLKQINIL